MDRISPSFDWEAFLAEDAGCLPPAQVEMPVVKVAAPAPKRSAVAPRPRQRPDDGLVVTEHADTGVSGILNCTLHSETRWTCSCGTSWRKPGRHNGTLRTCRSCGARYFLRVIPMR